MYLVHDPSHCPSLSDSEFVLKLRLSSTNTGHTLATGIVCIGAVDASHPAWIVLYLVRILIPKIPILLGCKVLIRSPVVMHDKSTGTTRQLNAWDQGWVSNTFRAKYFVLYRYFWVLVRYRYLTGVRGKNGEYRYNTVGDRQIQEGYLAPKYLGRYNTRSKY